jgi:hypothetical protein
MTLDTSLKLFRNLVRATNKTGRMMPPQRKRKAGDKNRSEEWLCVDGLNEADAEEGNFHG